MCLPTSGRSSTTTAACLTDTDWHIHQLYRRAAAGRDDRARDLPPLCHRRQPRPVGRQPLSRPEHHRADSLTDFDGQPIWSEGEEPDRGGHRGAARSASTSPYHAALAAEIERVKAKHGVAMLYDCHSIRSHMPVPVRGQAAGFQHRHQRRQDLRRPRSKRRLARSALPHAAMTPSSTAASRAAGRRATTAGRSTASTPSRWN